MKIRHVAALLLILFGIPLFAEDKIDFVRDVQPIFEGACIQCHGPDENELGGDYRMDTKAGAFKGGDSYAGETIIPGNAEGSPVYWMTTVHLDDPEDSDAMPPKRPLNSQQSEIIKQWIAQGAEWPDDVQLMENPRVIFPGVKPILMRGGKESFTFMDVEIIRYWASQGGDWPDGETLDPAQISGRADDENLTKEIREFILKNSTEKSEDEMKAYGSVIPKTGVGYEMVPIKGGEFTMGSPEDEAGRKDDEGPQHRVKIDPFWMGKFEVTWDQYEPFMITTTARNKDGSPKSIAPDAKNEDIVSSPTTPYASMSFNMGVGNRPAICMTQHAASKFCEWLSAQTGHFYRLPTEAEWEYACRAGSEGPFHCDEKDLAEYAVFDPDQTRTGYDFVGTKKPNAWGLHDMHGNVAEWCLDQYNENGYDDRDVEGVTDNPLARPRTLFPRVIRGGSWYDPADVLRSAARYGSHENWKMQDPQLPKSIWYLTEANYLGFRIVRPLAVPNAEEMHEWWNSGTRDIFEGGVFSLLDPGQKPADFEKEILPLLQRGGPFSATEIDAIRRWAMDGAKWPESVVLKF